MELLANAVSAVLAHHAKAGVLDRLLHGFGHNGERQPWLDGCQARFHAGAGDLDQALALGRDLTDAEHAARITKVAVQDRGAVDVDDVALVQHVRIAGDTVTDHVVDRGAYALGVALVVEVGRRAAVLDGVVVDHLVDLVGGHARGDVLAYVIEHAHVDGGRALDALDIGGRLVERAGQNLPALFPQALEALIKGAMAFLIFFAAAAPASVVAAGHGSFVKHG